MTGSEKKAASYDMLYLAACGVNEIPPDRARVEAMDLKAVYALSRSHSLTSITCMALEAAFDGKLPDGELFSAWMEDKHKIIRKMILLDVARMELLSFMEEQGIWYMPLKGVFLKELYPRPEMRQMADNDILFDAAYRLEVRDWFVAHGYTVEAFDTGNHDVYQKPPVLNFEMHVALFGMFHRPVWREYYADVKKRLLPDDGKRYGYHFSDGDFYIYMMLHAYKHYSAGGTGFRSLLDCFVYHKAKKLPWAELERELDALGIREFEEETRQLADKLFSKPLEFSMETLSEREREILDYCLSSGTYGIQDHLVKNEMTALSPDEERLSVHTRLRYMFRRLFPDRAFMEIWCRTYSPFFTKHPGLTWCSYLWRICRTGKRKCKVLWREFKIVWKT